MLFFLARSPIHPGQRGTIISSSELHRQISALTSHLSGKTLNSDLQDWLNHEHGVDSGTWREIEQSCRQGVAEGWLCQHEAGGIRYGRVFKPDSELHGFSVDVVDMEDVVGPHHRHPAGEIDLVMPISAEARFDGHAAGWVVYEAGSAHHPTVSDGRALILYLLPAGSIEFTR
jgi:hypothetical protein